MDYRKFKSWFDEIQPRVKTDFTCPDPFEKNKVIQKWLETAYQLGFNEGKNVALNRK